MSLVSGALFSIKRWESQKSEVRSSMFIKPKSQNLQEMSQGLKVCLHGLLTGTDGRWRSKPPGGWPLSIRHPGGGVDPSRVGSILMCTVANVFGSVFPVGFHPKPSLAPLTSRKNGGAWSGRCQSGTENMFSKLEPIELDKQ